MIECKHEWMHAWMDEWMNELINEYINEWMKAENFMDSKAITQIQFKILNGRYN
jgi:6-phosphogluconolactonase/glucosamine-6-phosphate isomerase/deaminase